MLRAVIYARCSTEEEKQKNALQNQVAEGKAEVLKKQWALVDSYIELRSGTTTQKRTEYNRLFEDLEKDKFDVIVIKSQDRLMRNTKDWYLFVDRLCTCDKKLYMYMEQKYYTADDALITGIKAILAEEYSRELSKKINNAHRNRQKSGGTVILTSNTYGYRKRPDKSVEIIEDEARIKRRMYELCAAGYGCRTAAVILNNEGVVNRKGKPFSDADILRIIRNPLNKGTVVMHREHYDFDTKRTIKIPEDEQYVYENKVPAIVSGDLWDLANEQISKRSIHTEKALNIGKNPGTSMLSGKLYCGLCKSPYYRRVRQRYKDKEKIYEWKCKRYLEIGRGDHNKMRPQLRKVPLDHIQGCDNVHIDEKVLMELLEQVCDSRYVTDKNKIVRKMTGILKVALQQTDFGQELERQHRQREKLKKQLDVLVDKLLEGIISDEVYQVKQKQLDAAISAVQENIRQIEQKNARGRQMQERLAFIEQQLKCDRLVKQASVAQMLTEIDRILIYPQYMELVFNLDKMLDLGGIGLSSEISGNIMKIEYGSLFDFYQRKMEGREAIVTLMKENPEITAKEIAAALGISLSGANYRIKALKTEGKIYFNGKGGKGKWVVKDDT